MNIINKILLLLSFFAVIACQAGLEPIGSDKGIIKGKVYFHNDWLADSLVKDVRVVAFKNYPPADIITEVISGQAVFSETLVPLFSDSAAFSIEFDDVPVKINYIVVARQYGSLFEWDAIGVYSDDSIEFTPKSIYIDKKSFHDIIINVDFNNPPPQPF